VTTTLGLADPWPGRDLAWKNAELEVRVRARVRLRVTVKASPPLTSAHPRPPHPTNK